MNMSVDDCIALSELDEEEIDAIARHENLPEIVAAELGDYLEQSKDGQVRIKQIIAEDIRTARQEGNIDRALTLKMVLKHYLERHPDLRSEKKDE